MKEESGVIVKQHVTVNELLCCCTHRPSQLERRYRVNCCRATKAWQHVEDRRQELDGADCVEVDTR